MEKKAVLIWCSIFQ